MKFYIFGTVITTATNRRKVPGQFHRYIFLFFITTRVTMEFSTFKKTYRRASKIRSNRRSTNGQSVHIKRGSSSVVSQYLSTLNPADNPHISYTNLVIFVIRGYHPRGFHLHNHGIHGDPVWAYFSPSYLLHNAVHGEIVP